MKITFVCLYCQKDFLKWPSQIKKKRTNRYFCSTACYRLYLATKVVHGECGNCNKKVSRVLFQYKKNKSGKMFCSHSCTAIYSNAHKTTGNQTSKLERYIQEKLLIIYPKINFIFNGKAEINSELDIYLPDFKLAFELNGIFHYEPIFGIEKLKQTQNNDNRKFQACLEKGIEFVTIDTCKFTYFKEEKAKKFLDIIITIINYKIKQNSCKST